MNARGPSVIRFGADAELYPNRLRSAVSYGRTPVMANRSTSV